MESNNNYACRPNMFRYFQGKPVHHAILLFVMLMTCIGINVQAQMQQYTRPSLWFGIAPGINFNFYRGSTQNLNNDLTVPTTFHDGNSAGFYIAPLIVKSGQTDQPSLEQIDHPLMAPKNYQNVWQNFCNFFCCLGCLTNIQFQSKSVISSSIFLSFFRKDSPLSSKRCA